MGTQVWLCEVVADGKAPPSLFHQHGSTGSGGGTWLCSLSRRPHLPVPCCSPSHHGDRRWGSAPITHSCSCPVLSHLCKYRDLLLTSKSAAQGAGRPQIPSSEALSPPDPDIATLVVHRPLQTQILVGNLCFYSLQALFLPALPPSLTSLRWESIKKIKQYQMQSKTGWWEFVFWVFLLFYCFPKE